jgi:hypothetical protein
MITYLAAITTAGEMSFSDIKNECGKEGWAPLVVYEVEAEGKSQVVLPLFTSEEVCKQWCKRNLSKEWKLFGGCFLEREDLENFEKNKGWRFQSFSFPRKVKDVVVEFRVEPCELNSKPDVYAK